MNKKVLVFKDIKNNRWTLWNEKRTIHYGYRKHLMLANCQFLVDLNKRTKVLKTNKRFPHAWVIGTLLVNKNKVKKKLLSSVSYNPFKDKSFKQGRKSVMTSKVSFFDSSGKVWI